MVDASSLLNQLRTQTSALHSNLEDLPYYEALTNKQLPVESYVCLVRALAVVHAVLEQTLPLHNDTMRAIWQDDMFRFPLLEKDLAFFAPRNLPDIAPAQELSVQLTEHIRRRVVSDPVSIAGYLYVFEGSTMGAPVILKRLKEHFQFPGEEGTHYYSPYGEGAVAHWKAFRDRMNNEIPEEKTGAVIDAAVEAYNGLIEIHKKLFPFDRSALKATATSLNPEAGRHNVPQDESEFEAAKRASAIAWAELPYYQLRYGDRGKRFSDSDSAWLATLVELDQETLNKQIDWLARLLAVRGMPRWVMERHLTHLESELSNARPERAEAFSKLGRAAEFLRQKRLQQIGKEKKHDLLATFESAAPNDWQEKLPYSGQMLVSALADEKDGLDQSLPSLLEWLADPERFPQEWVDAILEVISRARS